MDDALSAFHRAAEVSAALATVEREHSGRRPDIQKVRYTHDAMIDLIIANPRVQQNELAAYFGYTVGWVSTVVNSDMFQAKLAQRRDEIVNPAIALSLEERFRAVTVRSLEVLQDKLSKDSAAIPDNLVLKAVEIGAKAMGVGGNAPPPSQPTDHLAGLASRLLALQGGARRGEVYEALQRVEDVEIIRQPSGVQDGASRRQGEEEALPAQQVQPGPHGQADGGSVAP